MRGTVSLLLALMLAASATPAAGAVQGGTLELSPFLGIMQFDHDQSLDDSLALGLRAAANLDRRFALELMLGAVSADGLDGAPDNDVILIGVDLLYHFQPESRLVPFLAGGVTAADFDPGVDGKSGRLMADIGGGVKYALSRAFALRGDVRYLWTLDHPDRENLLYTLGVAWTFGEGRGGAGTSVAPDSDRDGVPDDRDKCPDTPRDVKVNKSGCPVLAEEKISLAIMVEFDTGKWDIRPEYHDELAKVGDFLTKYPEVGGVIEGHTDSVGSREDNLALSQKRADAVRDYLVQKFGVASDRLAAKGFGPDKPIADNETPEGRQKNRRITGSFETVVKRAVTR